MNDHTKLSVQANIKEDQAGEGIEIPPDRLSEDVLRGIIEAFVLEEGTDYGHQDFSLGEKVRAVRQQLDSGGLLLVFDPGEGTCSIRRSR